MDDLPPGELPFHLDELSCSAALHFLDFKVADLQLQLKAVCIAVYFKERHRVNPDDIGTGIGVPAVDGLKLLQQDIPGAVAFEPGTQPRGVSRQLDNTVSPPLLDNDTVISLECYQRLRAFAARHGQGNHRENHNH